MQTRDDKLDHIIEKLSTLHVDLAVHIAKDEDQWRRIAETEDEIKEISQASAKLNKRHAALLSTLSAGIATAASIAVRTFL